LIGSRHTTYLNCKGRERRRAGPPIKGKAYRNCGCDDGHDTGDEIEEALEMEFTQTGVLL
jgi:hypothetical protein